MTTVVLSPIGSTGQQFFDNNGQVLSGGLLYTYQAGTTTPEVTYTDESAGTPNANPIVLDSAGRISGGVWAISGTNYKFVLTTSTGTSIGSWDNVTTLIGITSTQATNIANNTATIAAIASTAALATTTAGSSMSLNTWTKLAYDTALFDLGSNYSVSNYRFTAPATGNYLVSALAEIDGKATPVVAEYCLIAIYKNGSSYLHGSKCQIANTSSLDMYPTASVVMHLTAGDYVEIWGYGQGAAGAWSFQSSSLASYFSVTRIS